MTDFKKPNKRPPPFSIRLTEEERRRLQKEAGDIGLGTYIKAKALGGATLRRSRRVHDHRALAKAVALLGNSRISSNLNQLVRLGHIGALPLTPETEAELLESFRHVREIRALLLKALGQKVEPEEEGRVSLSDAWEGST